MTHEAHKQMAVPREVEHMEVVEVQLLLALSGAEEPRSGLDLSGEIGVPVKDAFPALHRLVRNGYIAHHKRHYTATPAGTRLMRHLRF